MLAPPGTIRGFLSAARLVSKRGGEKAGKKEGRISSVLTPRRANFPCAERKRKHELFDLQLQAWRARGKQASWPAQKVGVFTCQ